MTVNPLQYLSSSHGTLNLTGSTSEGSSTTEEKDTQSAGTDENELVDTTITDDINDVLEASEKQTKSLKNRLSQLLSNFGSGATNAVSSVGNAVSGAISNIAQKLNGKFKGALSGMGDAIASAAQKYGLEPELLAAIMALETGWGTSSAVNNQNNPGGLMDPSSNWMSLQKFATIQEGIEAMAKNLKTGYIDQGLTTISAIGNKYCPVGAANDPNGTNGGWIPSVTQIYNELKA